MGEEKVEVEGKDRRGERKLKRRKIEKERGGNMVDRVNARVLQ